ALVLIRPVTGPYQITLSGIPAEPFSLSASIANLTGKALDPLVTSGEFSGNLGPTGIETFNFTLQVPQREADTAQICVAPPAGLIGWWPGDGNSSDIAGGHAGTLLGGTIFVQGMVGGAFSFNGVDGYIQTSAAQVDTAAITYEAW